MSLQTVKPIIAGFIGVVYAVIYGFWTMLATGGGHGNFLWFWLFLYVDLFGLYFPMMAVMMTNLDDAVVLRIFGILGLLNLGASLVFIAAWLVGLNGSFSEDIQKLSGTQLLFCGFVHFLPTLVFLFAYYKAKRFGVDPPGEEITHIDLT